MEATGVAPAVHSVQLLERALTGRESDVAAYVLAALQKQEFSALALVAGFSKEQLALHLPKLVDSFATRRADAAGIRRCLTTLRHLPNIQAAILAGFRRINPVLALAILHHLPNPHFRKLAAPPTFSAIAFAEHCLNFKGGRGEIWHALAQYPKIPQAAHGAADLIFSWTGRSEALQKSKLLKEIVGHPGILQLPLAGGDAGQLASSYIWDGDFKGFLQFLQFLQHHGHTSEIFDQLGSVFGGGRARLILPEDKAITDALLRLAVNCGRYDVAHAIIREVARFSKSAARSFVELNLLLDMDKDFSSAASAEFFSLVEQSAKRRDMSADLVRTLLALALRLPDSLEHVQFVLTHLKSRFQPATCADAALLTEMGYPDMRAVPKGVTAGSLADSPQALAAAGLARAQALQTPMARRMRLAPETTQVAKAVAAARQAARTATLSELLLLDRLLDGIAPDNLLRHAKLDAAKTPELVQLFEHVFQRKLSNNRTDLEDYHQLLRVVFEHVKQRSSRTSDTALRLACRLYQVDLMLWNTLEPWLNERDWQAPATLLEIAKAHEKHGDFGKAEAAYAQAVGARGGFRGGEVVPAIYSLAALAVLRGDCRTAAAHLHEIEKVTFPPASRRQGKPAGTLIGVFGGGPGDQLREFSLALRFKQAFHHIFCDERLVEIVRSNAPESQVHGVAASNDVYSSPLELLDGGVPATLRRLGADRNYLDAAVAWGGKAQVLTGRSFVRRLLEENCAVPQIGRLALPAGAKAPFLSKAQFRKNSRPGKLRVGFAWRSVRGYGLAARNEIPAAWVAEVIAACGIMAEFWSLQAHDEGLGKAMPMQIPGLDVIANPLDTLKVIAELDGVITNGTSIRDFAGVMGVPCLSINVAAGIVDRMRVVEGTDIFASSIRHLEIPNAQALALFKVKSKLWLGSLSEAVMAQARQDAAS